MTYKIGLYCDDLKSNLIDLYNKMKKIMIYILIALKN